jgi:RNA polymerase sigma-70 factor (ECF subfamily)
MQSQEAELGRRIAQGDAEALDLAYREFGPRVLGFALRLCGNRSEAEDITQEVFLAVYSRSAIFQRKGRLLTWLLGIALRRWRDRCRYTARRPAIALNEEALACFGNGSTTQSLELHTVETIVLDQALQMLDEPFREALLLVHSQGLTYREVAELRGEPVGTVKWRVSEGSRRLRQILTTLDTYQGEKNDGLHATDRRVDRTACRR